MKQTLFAATIFALGAAAPAAADPDATAAYRISIAGLDIGETSLRYREEFGRYELAFDGGFAFLFFEGGANGQVAGVRSADGYLPEKYSLFFEGPTRDSKIFVDFTGGKPARWAVEPPPEPEWIENRIPIADDHLPGAVDPLTAFLVLAKTAGEACAHGAKVFTGFVRFDLALETRRVDPAGVAECGVRYTPVSGHRRESEGVERLRKGGLSLSLFELAEGVWAPHKLGFRTSVGTLEIERVN